jgi:hypothetical protein
MALRGRGIAWRSSSRGVAWCRLRARRAAVIFMRVASARCSAVVVFARHCMAVIFVRRHIAVNFVVLSSRGVAQLSSSCTLPRRGAAWLSSSCSVAWRSSLCGVAWRLSSRGIGRPSSLHGTAMLSSSCCLGFVVAGRSLHMPLLGCCLRVAVGVVVGALSSVLSRSSSPLVAEQSSIYLTRSTSTNRS